MRILFALLISILLVSCETYIEIDNPSDFDVYISKIVPYEYSPNSKIIIGAEKGQGLNLVKSLDKVGVLLVNENDEILETLEVLWVRNTKKQMIGNYAESDSSQYMLDKYNFVIGCKSVATLSDYKLLRIKVVLDNDVFGSAEYGVKQ